MTDFSAASRDKLLFSNSGFDLGLSGATETAQKLPGSLFVANNAGKFRTTTQRFAYDTQTGQLYYDAGGSATPTAQHLVVTLDSYPALVAGNLFFIEEPEPPPDPPGGRPRTPTPRLAALGADAFAAELAARFGDFLGAVEPIGPRSIYPLGLMLAERYAATRLALVGEAAHLIQPDRAATAGPRSRPCRPRPAGAGQAVSDARRDRDLGRPGANAAATSARFCSSLQRRRRSGPLISWYLTIAPSLAPMQTPVLSSRSLGRRLGLPLFRQGLTKGGFRACVYVGAGSAAGSATEMIFRR